MDVNGNASPLAPGAEFLLTPLADVFSSCAPSLAGPGFDVVLGCPLPNCKVVSQGHHDQTETVCL